MILALPNMLVKFAIAMLTRWHTIAMNFVNYLQSMIISNVVAMTNRSTPKVTSLSVHYNAKLNCYQIAIEADNGNNYLGKHKSDSMRRIISFLDQEIRILESTGLETGGDQNCM